MERWFQARIHRPQEGATSLPTPAPDREILPSAHLSPGERLDLYSNMYFARLHDALAEDYPAVRQAIGPDRFEALAREYFRKFPSRSYSLNFLGRKFPDFLGRAPLLPQRAALRDLAVVENAMAEVFDAEESVPLAEKDFRAVPASAWSRARLVPIPALRLLELRHAVNAAINSSRQGKRPPRIGRKESLLAVYRKDDRVWRMELSRPQFEALRALARGETLAGAVRRFSLAWKGGQAALPRQIHRAFSEWAREGFFASIRTAQTRKDGRS